MATEDEFRTAVEAVSGLTKDPGNDTKLRLYALYKQATAGDVAGKRPGMMDFVGRAKHDAWAAARGTDPKAARTEYVEIVRGLSG
ncbi:acyl-CoA-binding protein [Arthrobacter sp. NEB 688]|uniref:acyl-CoA-binding protein n=1 Tax=Arthrobacter sp. NEB 688 TaxID=904039 RepID=UPI00156796BE|nr:acyl-CoA-binding protein [Arthrobacter sp. NEB 688]QKE85189.1 acyl-CoA-binding protein [Arthrobacter sp. NEB 688]